MSTATKTLPDDIADAHQVILDQQDEIQSLSQQLAYLKRMIFGQKKERHIPSVPEEQMTLEGLYDTAGAKIPGFAESKETITYDRRKPAKGHGRKPIPDDLHREEIVIDAPEEEKVCSCCGTEKKRIGEDVCEELEFKPAVFYVNKFIRPKYACPKCPDNGVSSAAMPPRSIDKGIAGPGLLAYIIVSKYVDHLPLYRLQQMFKRYQILINRSTMAGWIAQLCVHLEAVYREMKKQLIEASFLIQADETTLKVQNDTVPEKCDLGYMWPFVGDGKIAVFEFRDSRSREGPTDFLSGFSGRYLMSDGYAGYNQVIERNQLTHLMCWAHARRKFFEKKDLEPQFADQVLGLIKELYMVERDAVEMNPDERKTIRLDRSAPVLAEIKSLLEERSKTLLPKNPLCEAVNYTLNHWKQLSAYLANGRLPIDNNLVENAIRPVALGRKNWLFAGSPEGAKRMAIIYSLAATCKLNGVNPYEYFVDILPKVASYGSRKIADLTPITWKMNREEK